MKNLKSHKRSKDVLVTGIVMFIAVTVMLVFMPVLVTKNSLISLNIDKPNEIGDTIGGILGPSVALLAAMLTFLAFWAQYDANMEQRKQFEEVQVNSVRDKVEGRFFELLKVYVENKNGILKEDANAFAIMVQEYENVYFTLEATISTSGKQLNASEITSLAYEIFFFGSYKKTRTGNYSFQQMAKIVQPYLLDEAPVITSAFLEKLSTNEQHIVDKLRIDFEGHQEKLGQYYRHLFQTVKYINSQPSEIFDYRKKYGYIKILRAQLSTYEQILLFYNSCSSLGKAWEFGDDLSENEKLITKYNLIKNIPVIVWNFPLVRERFPFVYFERDSKKSSKRLELEQMYS